MYEIIVGQAVFRVLPVAYSPDLTALRGSRCSSRAWTAVGVRLRAFTASSSARSLFWNHFAAYPVAQEEIEASSLISLIHIPNSPSAVFLRALQKQLLSGPPPLSTTPGLAGASLGSWVSAVFLLLTALLTATVTPGGKHRPATLHTSMGAFFSAVALLTLFLSCVN